MSLDSAVRLLETFIKREGTKTEPFELNMWRSGRTYTVQIFAELPDYPEPQVEASGSGATLRTALARAVAAFSDAYNEATIEPEYPSITPEDRAFLEQKYLSGRRK